jgi:hypothetical protein
MVEHQEFTKGSVAAKKQGVHQQDPEQLAELPLPAGHEQ